MNPNDLTAEQRADIEARVEKAKVALQELQLQPTASVASTNIGDDVFATKVVVYLKDMKFVSPVQQKDLK